VGSGPVDDSLFAAVGRSLCACPHPHRSGSRRLFRICHLSCIRAHISQWVIIYVASTWLISYPPHSSHFGNTCLVFVNFLPFSNRRFPYLGLVGIFAAQIIHSGFLFQFVRQVTSVGIPYTRHSQGPLPQEGMCHDVTTTLFFCPHLATSCFALRESSSCLSFRHFPLTETASSCTPQLPTPTTVQ